MIIKPTSTYEIVDGFIELTGLINYADNDNSFYFIGFEGFNVENPIQIDLDLNLCGRYIYNFNIF